MKLITFFSTKKSYFFMYFLLLAVFLHAHGMTVINRRKWWLVMYLKDLYVLNVIVLHLKTDCGYFFFQCCVARVVLMWMIRVWVTHVHMNGYKNIDFPIHAPVFIAMFPYLSWHRKLCNTFDISLQESQAIV